MRHTKKLTLEEIGARVGVSRSTVSRVLNHHPDVAPDVRARVEAVVEETGFQPNQAARALVSQKTGLIGLVMLTEMHELFGDPYYSALVAGIDQGCAEHGLIFSMFPVQSAEGRPDLLSRQFAQGFVDGVIVTAGPFSDPLIEVLRDRGTNMVVIGHPRDTSGLRRIDVDNRTGSELAATHLIERGRQRVGFIGPTSDYHYGAERIDGYRGALTAAGRTVDDRLICLDYPSVDGGHRAAQQLLVHGPDAIHVATDTMAVGVYEALNERGLRIPDDVAVVGFDGFTRAAELAPPLTTVVQPVEEVGRRAVELLAEASTEPREIILPVNLHIRASA